MIVDGAAYQIAIDALTHTGPADIARVRSDGGTAMACLPGSFAPGISVLNLPALVKSIVMDVLEICEWESSSSPAPQLAPSNDNPLI